MDDRLEKFINDHRDELDAREPRVDLWSKIEGELPAETKVRPVSRSILYWRAAAVILFFISSWLVIDKLTESDPTSGMQPIVQLNPQLSEAESYYFSLIDQKREEITALSEQYELGEDFLSEIDLLDSMYVVLREDLDNGNEENLVDAMILNLQLRIEILNQQLSIIKSIENSQNDEEFI